MIHSRVGCLKRSNRILLNRVAEWQLQVTETWNCVLEVLLAVILTAAGPSVDVILRRGGSWLLRWTYALEKHFLKSGRASIGGVRQPLLGSHGVNGQLRMPAYGATGERNGHDGSLVPTRPGDIVDGEVVNEEGIASGTDADSPAPAPPNSNSANYSGVLASPSSSPDKPEIEAWSKYAVKAVVYLGFLGWALGSFFAGWVSSDKNGLIASDACGAWDPALDNTVQQKHDLYLAQKEIRSGRYARECYGKDSLLDSNRCGLFYVKDIPYTRDPGRDCPFGNRNSLNRDNICNGLAINFDTGYLDANLLGLNVANPPKFRLSTTCVPLNTKVPFTKDMVVGEHNETERRYYYGRTSHSEFTFNVTGKTYDWRVPAYIVK